MWLKSSNDNESASKVSSTSSTQSMQSFKSFQYKYLTIYLLAMAADWLQGPYVYALYESYGFKKSDIAFLFVSGFLSSMCFGIIVGPIADKYGRKLMSIIFGVLYSASCLTKLVNDFGILLAGRVLGGISTSLLFSVFESWMVAEHNAREYPDSLLSSTFYIATFLNGIVAIFAGLWSSFAADRWGFVSPFMWALGLLVICTVLIITSWNENYGNSSVSLEHTFRSSFQYLMNDRSIIKLGFIQSLFEASMYTFVFMWTPTLQESGSQVGELPFGLIFATFMVCIMIGSSIFNMISKQASMTTERLACWIFGCAIGCMSIPYLFPTQSLLIYISFLVFEICCGLYFPTIGTLRSKYIPESARTSIMNYFRVPLNFMVVVVLSNISSISTTNIFLVCTLWLSIALVLQNSFVPRSSSNILPKSINENFISVD
ncbi:hypothetical protein PPL_11027 [Heterostelium album PN500]|uniref:Molybdate-anion transporter n=1 Tax=Heterostelium pallidum (strain ATCC 26659 / Pp 5 / PN500) TaxID=670386 RepID=D3BSQ8_HETP5|nr:hypothetical protein PPL_11027 [Heterostelium album PN500]EFA75523.1 hypothetical protein PPL_11027 [Heterostelium album PN500]|eukprot:XP_020427657.1 hypothetical protein PPL_11027 [Heterostelium album PN500]